uniref:Glycosyltransferase 2-like domain-containing protein n=1 Tax=viral metagenome TaxID=1070528 RepID=A0A6C0KKH4_9ZZZZ
MLTIAITTMRRFVFLKENIPTFLAHPQVNEVVVCDETGEDAALLEEQPFYTNPKLRVITNDSCLGIYQNKRKSIGISMSKYVAVLDSDNYFSEEWIDEIVEALRNSDGKTLFASADFKNINLKTNEFTFPCQEFSGLRLDKTNWNLMFERPRWNFLLNDGNWVVPRTVYTSLPKEVSSESLQAADAIFMLKCFIQRGYSIHYLPGLSYVHTVHDGSTWLQTAKESTRILNTTDWRL